MISAERILNEFVKLSSFDSESFSERKIVDYLKQRLSLLGLMVSEDDADVLMEHKNDISCLWMWILQTTRKKSGLNRSRIENLVKNYI